MSYNRRTFIKGIAAATALILPILFTTIHTFLVEFQKVILSLFHQVKRKKALLASNLSGIT